MNQLCIEFSLFSTEKPIVYDILSCRYAPIFPALISLQGINTYQQYLNHIYQVLLSHGNILYSIIPRPHPQMKESALVHTVYMYQ